MCQHLLPAASARWANQFWSETMDFKAQTYCFGEDSRLSLLEPETVSAPSHAKAAEAKWGKDLIEAGPLARLAGKIWIAGTHPLDIKLFYRP
jgi:hypothetical protein